MNDERAFEQLFRDTRGDLLAYLVRRASTAEDAADLLAETYLIAWRKLDAIPSGEQARLWLFGVARNLLLKGASRRRFHCVLVERLAHELQTTPLLLAVDDDRSEALRAALARLPENQREVVLLTAWEGLTPRQIAAVTATPVNLVRVRLHRARATLRRALGRLNAPQRRSAEASSGESTTSACETRVARIPSVPSPRLVAPLADETDPLGLEFGWWST